MRWPEGDLCGLDLETTGVDPMTALPVSYAFVSRIDGQMKIDAALVDPGVPIPEGATKVHGITNKRAEAEGLGLELAMSLLVIELQQAVKAERPLIIMNAAYDLTVIDSTIRRMGSPGLVELDAMPNVLDLLVLDRQVDKWRHGRRTLDALCETYGVSRPMAHTDSHTAVSDVYAAVRCTLALAAKTQHIRVQPPAELHRLQTKWSDLQKLDLSKHFEKKGDPPIPAEEYGWPIRRGTA